MPPPSLHRCSTSACERRWLFIATSRSREPSLRYFVMGVHVVAVQQPLSSRRRSGPSKRRRSSGKMRDSGSGFGERLREALRLRKMSQRKLGKITGISDDQISRLVSGERGTLVSYERVVLLARALDVPERWLGLGEGHGPGASADPLPNRTEAIRLCREHGVADAVIEHVKNQTVTEAMRAWSTVSWISAILFAAQMHGSNVPHAAPRPPTLPPPTEPSPVAPGSHVRPRADTPEARPLSTQSKK
jgi:transcriptional regulator with XRE-family HTH domain